MAGRDSLIALLTDFGTKDPYVAAMKGVIASRSDARVIDLSHEITPYDVFEAAFFLRFVLGDLPPCRDEARTVLVAVIDPGVGSDRRIVAADCGGRLCLAPDNGVLMLVAEESREICALENDALQLQNASRTFHGRDIFAPVAAALANGLPLGSLGPKLPYAALKRLDYEEPSYGSFPLRGRIISVDRFGNCVTDLEPAKIGSVAPVRMIARSHEIGLTVDCYDDAPEGEPFLIRGSRGTLEISMKKQSAADKLQLARFDSVVVERQV